MNRFIGIGLCWLLSLMIIACDDDNGEVTYAGDAKAAFGTVLLKVPENVTPLRIPVSLSAPVGNQVTVTGYVKKEDNAAEGTDYTFLTKQIVIPAGESVGYFEVEVKDYFEWKPERAFEFELVDVQGAGLTKPDVCQVVISSNEGLPQLGFAATLLSVSEDMQATEIAVELSRPADQEVTFRLHPVKGKGTAVFGKDYLVDTVKVYTIPAGELSTVIHIQVEDDILDNGDRSFELELYENTGTQLSAVFRSVKVTILDDEDPVYVSFAKTQLKGIEGDTIWVPVKIQGTHKAPVKVSLRAAEGGGSAVEFTDFKLLDRELTLPVGFWEDSVRVELVNNNRKQPERGFRLGLASVEGALAAEKDTLINVTISDDDFDFVELYEKLMGEWTMIQTAGDGRAPEVFSNLIISGGDTPEEEDENYLKRLVCTAKAYATGDLRLILNYDVNTGAISVDCTLPVMYYNFDPPFENSDVKLEPLGIWPTTPSKDYRTITWKPGTLKGITYNHDTGVRTGAQHMAIKDVVLTKNR